MTSAGPSRGVVDRPSHHSVAETVDRFEAILRTKGITLFAVIDHSGAAERVGLKMPPTKLLVFGKSEAGTPLMLAHPRVAIDLPLKAVVWEDNEARVWVSTNAPAYLQERHGLAAECLPTLSVVEAIAAAAAE